MLSLAGVAPALAFDAHTQAVLERMKVGKRLPIDEVAVLMRGAQYWCYAEADGACAWSDIYFDVDAHAAGVEIANAWSETYTIFIVDKTVFTDEGLVCESGTDWIQSLRAISRPEAKPVSGRELAALRQEVAASWRAPSTDRRDCFDYILQGHDSAAQTITLLQRQYPDGAVADRSLDVPVTLHFAPGSAADLRWSF